MHSDLFSRPDSIFAVYFSIRNFNILGDEISRPIHVIFNGDNFAQWFQVMRSYLKGRKLWLYVSGDHPIPEQVDKETDTAPTVDPTSPSDSHALRRSHRVTTLPSHLHDFHCFSALASL